MRRLPGPADYRLGDGGNSRGSLRFVSGLAENTNSIFCADSAESQTANGCPVLPTCRNHQPRGTVAWWLILISSTARSPERAQRPRAFFLTSDLHGCRLSFPLAILRLPVFPKLPNSWSSAPGAGEGAREF